MFLSRRVASGRSGEGASEWRLTIDGPRYEGLTFDCGGCILLLSYVLLRVESPCVVASASQRIYNIVSRLNWCYNVKTRAQTLSDRR